MYSASDDSGFPNTDKETNFSALIAFAFPIPYNFGTESHPVNAWAASIERTIDLCFLTVSLIEIVVQESLVNPFMKTLAFHSSLLQKIHNRMKTSVSSHMMFIEQSCWHMWLICCIMILSAYS